MKPRINLCVYNHMQRSILDQIWFSQEVFAQHGYELICSRTLQSDCINLLIENFVEEDLVTLQDFCRRFDKQIGIVMTEHIELGKRGFTFNGAPLQNSEYIDNKEQRLFSALALADHVFAFFTFGELPELHTWSDVLPCQDLYRLPYPSIRKVSHRPVRREHDVVFTGAPTPYRESVLKQVGRRHRLVQGSSESTEAERADLYASAKVALNVPQAKSWQWVSPMRVLYGLRVGTPTVHLGRHDSTLFTKLVLEPTDLDQAISEHEALFQRQLGSYEDFVQSNYNHRFPDGVFDVWAELERLH
jgi:hypothetical protein